MAVAVVGCMYACMVVVLVFRAAFSRSINQSDRSHRIGLIERVCVGCQTRLPTDEVSPSLLLLPPPPPAATGAAAAAGPRRVAPAAAAALPRLLGLCGGDWGWIGFG